MILHRLAVLAVGVVFVVPACDAKSNVESTDLAAVEATIQAARDALAAGNAADFGEFWTDNGLLQVFHEDSVAFRTNTAYYVEAKQFSLGDAVNTAVHGDTATTVVPLFFRLVGVVRELTLVKVGELWRIDGATLTTTDAGDARVIGVEFGADAIQFDRALIVDGNIALRVHNPTSVVHELNILTAPADQDLADFFEHPENGPPVPEGRSMPDGFDFVGGVSSIAPGETVTILFARELPAARYAMFCNAETDALSEPHSERGEFGEFTIA